MPADDDTDFLSLPPSRLLIDKRTGVRYGTRTDVRIRSTRGKAAVNKTRLTPLGRLLALVAIITFGAVAGAAGAAASKPHARAWRCVAVRPGDTLWGFAGTVEKQDPRDAVQRIVDEN